MPEAVKYSQSVTGTTATAQQPSKNNLVSIPSTRQAPKQAPQAEQMTQSDDEEIDHAAGPVFDGAPPRVSLMFRLQGPPRLPVSR